VVCRVTRKLFMNLSCDTFWRAVQKMLRVMRQQLKLTSTVSGWIRLGGLLVSERLNTSRWSVSVSSWRRHYCCVCCSLSALVMLIDSQWLSVESCSS